MAELVLRVDRDDEVDSPGPTYGEDNERGACYTAQGPVRMLFVRGNTLELLTELGKITVTCSEELPTPGWHLAKDCPSLPDRGENKA